MVISAPKLWSKTDGHNKAKTVVGAYLLTLPIGLQWNWGNLAPYVYSYVLRHHPDTEEGASPWLLSLFLVAMNLSFLVSGLLAKYTGKRLATVIGILAFNTGMVSSYYVIRSLPSLLDLTLGVIVGVGSGILTNMGMVFTLEWANKDVGFLTSLYLSAVNIGSILINEMTTYYVNPSNLSADIIRGDFAYFSQIQIVDNVPDIFLLVGFSSLVLQLIGLLLVRLKDRDDTERLILGNAEKSYGIADQKSYGLDDQKSYDSQKSYNLGQKSYNLDQKSYNLDHKSYNYDGQKSYNLDGQKSYNIDGQKSYNLDGQKSYNLDGQKSYNIDGQKSYGLDCQKSYNLDDQKSYNIDGQKSYGRDSLARSSDVRCQCELSQNCKPQLSCCSSLCQGDPNYSPDSYLSKHILRSKTFYVLCVCFILVEYPYILLANYYKAFGILEISDDHFLAEIGSLMILVSAISRVIYGRLMDKFGVKDNMICMSALLAFGCTFYFFSVLVNKWVYAAMTICLASISCAQYNSFIVATVTIFGIDNASFNVGMLLTAGIVLNVVAPVGIEYIFRFLGWFSLFAGGSVMTLIEMIMIIVFLPKI